MDGLCAQMSRRTFPPLMTGVVVALVLLLGEVAAAQVPGWDSRWPPPEKMLQGQDPAKIQEFRRSSDALKKNPKEHRRVEPTRLGCHGDEPQELVSHVLAMAGSQGSGAGDPA